MNNNFVGISVQTAAKIGGWGLLIMTILFITAEMLIIQSIYLPSNASLTIENLHSSKTLFRVAIFMLVFVLILDILVAWAFYVLLENVNKYLSLLAAWFRLIYAAILGFALSDLIHIFPLIEDAEYVSSSQMHNHVLIYFRSFYNIWDFGLIVFGFHLITLGYLVSKSHLYPRILGILLSIAGFSYLLDKLVAILFPDVDLAFSIILGWGELIFMFYLLFKNNQMGANI